MEQDKNITPNTGADASAPQNGSDQQVLSESGVKKTIDLAKFPLKAILGTKVGMTSVYNDVGVRIPVTVVLTEGCALTGLRTMDRDGYQAVELSLGSVKEKNVPRSYIQKFKVKGLNPFRWVKEFRVSNLEGCEIGQTIPSDIFKAGEYVDISGTSKGKGYAGPMKRHNFRGLTESHGASDKVRARGSSAGGSGAPQRVYKGTKMAGRLGGDWITTSKVEVVQSDPQRSILLLNGSVPGAVGSFVSIRQTTKARKVRLAKQAQKVSVKKQANVKAGKK